MYIDIRSRCFFEKKSIPLFSAANPTTSSYNASAVKIYNATSSLVRFKSENIFFCFEKTLYPTYYKAGVVVVKSKAIGLSPEFSSDFDTLPFQVSSTNYKYQRLPGSML
jgi:hypothetical protein